MQASVTGYNLSPQQERLWDLFGSRGQANAVVVAGVLVEAPRLESRALVAAVRSVAARHEILRTTFAEVPGLRYPIQSPERTWSGHSPVVDLTRLPEPARLSQIDWLVDRLPASADCRPVLHAPVVTLSTERAMILLCGSGLVLDRPSVAAVVRDIGRAYDCQAAGGGDAPDEPIQYVDYATGIRELLDSDEGRIGRRQWAQPDLAEWTRQRLPRERAGSPAGAMVGACTLPLAPDLLARVEALAPEFGASASTFFLTCWQVLLWRLVGGAGVVIGSWYDGRTFDGTDSAVGPYARCLPLRLPIDARWSFGEALAHATSVAAAAGESQDYFDWSVVHGGASSGGGPHCPYQFEWRDRPASYASPHIRLAAVRQHAALEPCHVDLTIARDADSARAEFAYSADLLDAGDVADLIERWQTLVHRVAADPAVRVAEVPIVGPAEAHRLGVGRNAASRRVIPSATAVDLFDTQARERPSTIAVRCEDERLTYGALHRRANQLARYLVERGVGIESRVGILLGRSADVIVTMLATMKAGACCVPLDPRQPTERLATMLREVNVTLVVSTKEISVVRRDASTPCVRLDADRESIAAHSPAPFESLASPERMAYVVFTSGSTGHPKAVAIEHRNLASYVHAVQEQMQVTPGAHLAHVSTFAADLGNTVVYVALCWGGTLHIIGDDRVMDGARLAEYFESNPVDYLKVTPSHADSLFAAAGTHRILPRRLLVLGGETATRSTVERLRASTGSCGLLNHYGPTETTIGVLTYPVPPTGMRELPDDLPLGRPLPGVAAYILDGWGGLVPDGGVGELYIGGSSVGRGYLNSAVLTAERFLPDPFGGEAGARLYATGDQAKYARDGTIQFLGRTDHQIKVRGYRVELGEVEAVLRDHPALRDAVVIARDDDAAGKTLMAYFVPHPRHASTIEGRARERMPDGTEIVTAGRSEAEQLHGRILERRTYLQHGIALPQGACVFDVGAHVGLFTTFVARECEGATLYAFEPAEASAQALRINTSLYAPSAKGFAFALGARESLEPLHCYANAPMLSALAAHDSGATTGDVQRRYCRVRRLSDVMHEEAVEKIDLLKIDVVGAELDVLDGIDEHDWTRISQIVVRVYGTDATRHRRLEAVASRLRSRGLDVAPAADDADSLVVCAVRTGERPQPTVAPTRSADWRAQARIVTVEELRRFAAERLPDYMMPGVWVELEALPLTANGKIDRQALRIPDTAPARGDTSYVAPRTVVEEVLANIWADVLRRERVGAADNFLELGGQSLLAMQVLWRVREAFRVDVPLRALFESPTVAAVAAVVEEIRRSDAPASLPPIERAVRAGDMQVSFAQERLWFVDQLTPASVAYNMPTELRLRGRLDIGAFEGAVRELTRRHEVLRTSFPSVGGLPVQRIAPEIAVVVPVADLTRLSPLAGKREARRLAQLEARRPFDLSKTPLLRAMLLRLGPEDHAVVATMHHIVSDGWSVSVLVREFTAVYRALADRRPVTLPELPVQYADYAVWQRAQLTGTAMEHDLTYWRQQLAGPLPVLELGDRHAAGRRWTAGRASRRIAPDTAAAVHQVSRRHGATLFMTLLATLEALLHRYTGHSVIVVGTPVAGRNRTELEGLIGFFVNTLALCGHVTGDTPFADLLARVRDATLDAWAHQDVPFERVVEAVQPERSASSPPLFQVSFAVRNAPSEALALDGLSLELWVGDSVEPKLELAFVAQETGRHLDLSVEYARELFESHAIDRMLEHFERLLAAAAADPAQHVRDLPMLSDAESRSVLEDSNRRAAPVTKEIVPALVACQASQRPDAVAVRDTAGRAWTYRQVNRRANQWARRLRQLGVGPETRAAVCMERSGDLLMMLLAVWKAGGAYVPIDPTYPRERIAYMCGDADVAVLITQRALAAAMPEGARVAYVDDGAPIVATLADDDLQVVHDAASLAYVIYTSGSTGQPKGVMIPHAGLSNLVAWHVRTYGLDASDCGSHVASLSFDASVWEVWPCLAAGASVALIPGVSGMTPPELANVFRELAVTVAFLPTPLFDLIAAQGETSALGVRWLLVGGDVLHHGVQPGSGCRLVNHYGPTETSVVATACEVTDADAAPFSIGSPLPNTRAYVATSTMDVVPIGVTGELYLGGAGLARGYQGRPALTAERFVPDPFSPMPGARLYRTGDLARWRTDGQLAFLGRRDEQVKIRGCRVELGEVETVLGQHPDVEAAVVVVREEGGRSARLVGYVVPRTTPAPSSAALRTYLEERLPAYMVPEHFVELDDLPLTANGKVDRRARPDAECSDGGVETLGPRDITEMQVARIWEELLGVPVTHVETGFFKSGGTSLMLVVLRHKLEQLFNVRLSVHDVYQHDSVAGIAAVLRNSHNAPTFSCLAPLRPHGTKPPLFLVHPAGGTVMCFYELARRIASRHPLFAFRASGLEAGEEVHQTIEAMAEHYVDLLLESRPRGPYRLAGWSSGGVVAFEMAQVLTRRGIDVDMMAVLDTSCPLAYEDDLYWTPADSGELLVSTVGLPKTAGMAADEFRRLTLDEQLTLVLKDQRASRRVLGHVDLAYARRQFEVLRSGTEAIQRYSPTTYRGSIALFRATDAPEWTPLRALGWERCAEGGVDIFDVPGTHATMLTSSIVTPLANQLTALLDGTLKPVAHASYAPVSRDPARTAFGAARGPKTTGAP